jgi:AcrR family transcriptional regulator
MESSKQITAERILSTALELMKDKGFKTVTMRELAQASEVSEMTIMRHFQTKRGVLEAAVRKNSHHVGSRFKAFFESELVWALEPDLKQIALTYLNMMEMNQSVCLIAVQERTTMPELVSVISENTGRLKQFLVTYFEEMQEKGNMRKVNNGVQASLFLTTLFGYFLSTSLWENQFIKESKELFVGQFIESYCNGLKPVPRLDGT